MVFTQLCPQQRMAPLQGSSLCPCPSWAEVRSQQGSSRSARSSTGTGETVSTRGGTRRGAHIHGEAASRHAGQRGCIGGRLGAAPKQTRGCSSAHTFGSTPGLPATGQGEPQVPSPAGGGRTPTQRKTHRDTKGPVSAPSPSRGFSATGVTTRCSGKRALGLQAEALLSQPLHALPWELASPGQTPMLAPVFTF